MNTRHGRLERSQSGSAWAMGAAVGMFLAAVAAVNAADALRTEWALPAAATGGLIVQVGCGDARLAEEPPAGESLLACLLDTDPTRVAAVRDAVAARGRTGPVTVDRFDGANLPFVDGLVDLLVVHEPFALTHGECVRVLAPGGVLLCRRGAGDLSGPGLTADPAGTTAAWRRQIKPFPAEMDEWTHFLHGADGHAMSQDRMVGPPYHTQWVGAPRHARSHVHLTTVNAMVAAGGRLFVIADVGPTALPEDLPGRWALIARNAFNGIELWRRPLSSWQPYYVKDRNSFPADLHRRLVAADGRVFVTLHIHGPLSALDPASGETMHTYAGTEKLEDMVYEDGILFVAMNEGGTEELDRRRMAYRHVEPTRKRLAAVDAASGEVLWQKNDTDTEALLPMTLAARDASLYFQNSRHVVCVSKATGEVRWRADRPSEYFRPGWSSPTLTALDGVVVSADRQSGPGQRVGKDQYAAGGFSTGDVVVFDAGTGARLWSAPCAEGCRTPTDVFSLEGRLWFGKSLERKVHEYRESHDLRSGTVLHEAPLCPAWPNWHHHRCYRDKATVRYILAGRTGIEFIDLRTGEVQLHNWVRGSCKFGILPAHGLLTLPPEQCGCYIESKLTGFHALAAERPHMTGLEDAHPLEREPDIPGPANAASRARLPPLSPEDWPVYRHDTRRTGATPMAAPNDLEEAWRVLLGGRLTPPVAAHGLLLTAQIDTHTLHALDARTGARLWEFVAGGRIDSPPALAGGLAVFGCHDGWIYALHAADGRLCWRFRAAPAPHRLVDDGRLESVWPAHGSVLVQDGTVFYAAGRSSYVDGGIRMGTLSLPTGEPGIARTFYSRDPATGDAVTLYTPFSAEGPLGKMEMPGVLPDVLSSDGECLWMRSVTFNRALEIQPSFPPHLFSSMGFLDDSGWELSYWLYGPHMYSGRAGIAHAVTLYPTARIMVCGEDEVYGYQYGYEGIAAPRFIASAKVPVTRTVKLKKGSRSQVVHRWETRVPLHVQALVLAAHTLFLAGTPEVDTQATRLELEAVTTDEYHPSPVLRKALDTFLGRHGGVLVALDAADGTPRLERRLDVLPVFDGLIAANGSLYMSCRDGHVVCLRGKQPPQMNPPRP